MRKALCEQPRRQTSEFLKNSEVSAGETLNGDPTHHA